MVVGQDIRYKYDGMYVVNMVEITLEDTIKMMGGDWQDRFRAEYWQVKIREERLSKMLDRWEMGKLDFEPNCPYELLVNQCLVMRDYIFILEKRAKIENINLARRGEE